MSFEPGQSIGDYQIIDVLGAGGMGKVYRVRNVISGRLEAMKVLLPDLATEPELADRFTSEIKVLAGFNHPNIAALHTALRIDNQLVMLMELVEGITLEARLRQGPISLADCLNYISQVLEALSYAHEQGVIHRDIKPANMMLTPTAVVKLMDFGIAKSADAQKMTVTGATLGSLYYMSPEQVKGIHLDTRSDLYSLGVSLYELVTGQRPFQGDSSYSIMAAHLQATPRPPIELDPKLPKALNEIILTCLAKEPSHRFGSAKAVRTAIESVRATLGPSTPAGVQVAGGAGVAGGVPAGAATAILSGASTATAAPAGNQAPAQPVAAAPGVAPARGYRGFYMALGACVAVLVIVLTAMELPRWLKTRAGTKAPAAVGEQAAPAKPDANGASPVDSSAAAPQSSGSTSSTSQPASLPSAEGTSANTATPGASESVTPAASPATRSARPVENEASSGSTASSPASLDSSGRAAKSQPRERKAHATQESPAGGVSQVPASAGQAETNPSEPGNGSSAAAKPATQAMADATDRMTLLAARANAVKDSIENLRRQQNASGLSLRSDVSASLSRMEQYMDAADRAIAAGNAESAGKNMDRAESELQGLEKFLGK